MSIYRLKCIHRLYIIYHHETGRRRAVLMTFHYVYYCQVIVFDYIRRYMRTVQSKSKSNQIKYVTFMLFVAVVCFLCNALAARAADMILTRGWWILLAARDGPPEASPSVD